jgi:hypothetical protein
LHISRQKLPMIQGSEVGVYLNNSKHSMAQFFQQMYKWRISFGIGLCLLAVSE